jgi:hypothetical protein
MNSDAQIKSMVDSFRVRLATGTKAPTMEQQKRMHVVVAACWQAALLLTHRRDPLTTSQAKLGKAGERWRNTGLTMSSADEAAQMLNLSKWRTMCAWATASCIAACVGSRTGHGVLHSSLIARLGRTICYLLYRQEFLQLLTDRVLRLVNTCQRAGDKLAFRANIATDLAAFAAQLAANVRQFGWTEEAGLYFYDYSASFDVVMRRKDGVRRALSYKGPEGTVSVEHLRRALAAGHAVAIVGAGERPETLLGYPTIDGDLDDLWFLRGPKDGSGFVVWLKLKGDRAQKHQALESGFAVVPGETWVEHHESGEVRHTLIAA